MNKLIYAMIMIPYCVFSMSHSIGAALSALKVVAQTDPRFSVFQDVAGTSSLDLMMHDGSGNFLAQIAQGDQQHFLLNGDVFKITDQGKLVAVPQEDVLKFLSPSQMNIVSAACQVAAAMTPKAAWLQRAFMPALALSNEISPEALKDLNLSADSSVLRKFVEFFKSIAPASAQLHQGDAVPLNEMSREQIEQRWNELVPTSIHF